MSAAAICPVQFSLACFYPLGCLLGLPALCQALGDKLWSSLQEALSEGVRFTKITEDQPDGDEAKIEAHRPWDPREGDKPWSGAWPGHL